MYLQSMLQNAVFPLVHIRALGICHSARVAADRALDWMTTYARCAGCRNGGGPPDCAIRICARERGYELCSSCSDLESCTKFEWLGEYGQQFKEKLKESR